VDKNRPDLTPSSRTESIESQALHAYDMLRLRVRTAHVTPDVKFVEHNMISTLGVSRQALRNSARRLADQGILTRQVRDGTRVAGELYDFDTGRFSAIDWTAFELRETDAGQVIPSMGLVDRFGDVGQVSYNEQVLSAHGTPIGLRRAYFLNGVDAPERRDACTSDPAVFSTVYGTTLARIESALDVMDADGHLMARLALREGTRILLLSQALVDEDGTVQEQSFWHFRGDRVSLTCTEAL
jgi:GntR family transcriptional regulator